MVSSFSEVSSRASQDPLKVLNSNTPRKEGCLLGKTFSHHMQGPEAFESSTPRGDLDEIPFKLLNYKKIHISLSISF
jgi:hypothetical protein